MTPKRQRLQTLLYRTKLLHRARQGTQFSQQEPLDHLELVVKQQQTCFPLLQEVISFPEAVITKSPCDNKHDISPDCSKPIN